ncbi:MAG TPA: hypothetical protein VGF29_20640 [Hyphomicrobiaceae bacterium]|jgi:hypothetical protein
MSTVNVIRLLAGVSRDQVLRMQPAERAALVRECDRIAGLARIERGAGPARAEATQRVERVEPEDHPDY